MLQEEIRFEMCLKGASHLIDGGSRDMGLGVMTRTKAHWPGRAR